MATPSPPKAALSAQVIGDAFVEQYYRFLHNDPEFICKFYEKSSVLSPSGSDGVMSTSMTTMSAFNEMILSLDYKDCKVEIETVNAEDSFKGGVVVLVTGCLTTKKNNVGKKFTQSFFLAPRDRGYFVLNDIFRYVNVEDIEELHVPKRKKTEWETVS